MPLTKPRILAAVLITFTSAVLAQDAPEPLTVAGKILMAEFITGEALKSDKAAIESERIGNENEVRRLKIEAKNLDSQLSTSMTEIDQMRAELDRYRRLLIGAKSTNESPRLTPDPMRAAPLNLRVLNILSGENISTRARVMVLDENASAQGEFQVKEGGSVQGWSVESITPNSIIVTKDGQRFTYGRDGIM